MRKGDWRQELGEMEIRTMSKSHESMNGLCVLRPTMVGFAAYKAIGKRDNALFKRLLRYRRGNNEQQKAIL